MAKLFLFSVQKYNQADEIINVGAKCQGANKTGQGGYDVTKVDNKTMCMAKNPILQGVHIKIGCNS